MAIAFYQNLVTNKRAYLLLEHIFMIWHDFLMLIQLLTVDNSVFSVGWVCGYIPCLFLARYLNKKWPHWHWYFFLSALYSVDFGSAIIICFAIESFSPILNVLTKYQSFTRWLVTLHLCLYFVMKAEIPLLTTAAVFYNIFVGLADWFGCLSLFDLIFFIMLEINSVA